MTFYHCLKLFFLLGTVRIKSCMKNCVSHCAGDKWTIPKRLYVGGDLAIPVPDFKRQAGKKLC